MNGLMNWIREWKASSITRVDGESVILGGYETAGGPQINDGLIHPWSKRGDSEKIKIWEISSNRSSKTSRSDRGETEEKKTPTTGSRNTGIHQGRDRRRQRQTAANRTFQARNTSIQRVVARETQRIKETQRQIENKKATPTKAGEETREDTDIDDTKCLL